MDGKMKKATNIKQTAKREREELGPRSSRNTGRYRSSIKKMRPQVKGEADVVRLKDKSAARQEFDFRGK